MHARREVLTGLMATVTAFAVARAPAVFGAPGSAPPSTGRPQAAPAGVTLKVYVTNPTVVRAGERVLMPVDVVCTTPDGEPCAATVSLATRVGAEPWRLASTQAHPDLVFDLTGPAGRAPGTHGSGAVDFYLRAEGPDGTEASVGGPEPGRSLRVFVTRDLPSVDLPRVPFGRVERGESVLYLPWGTGALRAGLRLGDQAPTLGPSSFAVDGDGGVVLADAMQDRIAVFRAGRDVRNIPVVGGAVPFVAVAGSGDIFVLRSSGPSLDVRAVSASGVPASRSVPDVGVVSEVAAASHGVSARVLPADAWITFAARGAAIAGGDSLSPGLETSDGGQLVRIGREDSIRLARIRGDRVTWAVEIRSSLGLGEVALARPDGRGGCVLVVRVATDGPPPTDQFQVVMVAPDGDVGTFAVPSGDFATVPPLSRFVLDSRGDLFQLRTSPDGARIVRFDLEVAS
jgi:hypothetical protein